MNGRIIFLNGPSSAGKTTLARALRTRLPPEFCYFASDQLAEAGFRPIDQVSSDLSRDRFFDGFHRSIAAFASAGNDLLVEHIVEERAWADDLRLMLASFDVFWVGVFAPAIELSRRELARGDRALGEALYHLKTHSFCVYDIEIDSTRPIEENVDALLRAWEKRR